MRGRRPKLIAFLRGKLLYSGSIILSNLYSTIQHSTYCLLSLATEGHQKQLIQRGDEGVRGARSLGDVGGIESLVVGDSHWSLKIGSRFSVGKGRKVEEGRDREHKSPRKQHVLHSAAPGTTCVSNTLYTNLPLLISESQNHRIN